MIRHDYTIHVGERLAGRTILGGLKGLPKCRISAHTAGRFGCSFPSVRWSDGAGEWSVEFTSADRIELDPLLSFCAGHMPPYVFADWVEENVPDVPADALRLLRLPSAVESDSPGRPAG